MTSYIVTAQPKNMSIMSVGAIQIPKKIRKFRHKNLSKEDVLGLLLCVRVRSQETCVAEAVRYYAYKFGLAQVTIYKHYYMSKRAGVPASTLCPV